MTQADLARLSPDQLIAIIQQMAAQGQPNKLTFKVSEKGGVSVCGMGQWPTTLYKTQWLRLLDQADELREFIKTHDSVLSVKPPKG